jgi:TolB-like protein
LTSDLGRLRELFVVARSSAFLYRGAGVDVKRVGRELGVGYVVDGSLRVSGDEALVTAQLIDARSGFQVWSGRFQQDLRDVLELRG